MYFYIAGELLLWKIWTLLLTIDSSKYWKLNMLQLNVCKKKQWKWKLYKS